MIKNKRRMMIYAFTVALVLGLLAIAGCSPQQPSSANDSESTETSEASSPMSSMYSLRPSIVQLEDGTLIQRTPTALRNETVLEADKRGCYSCHSNLGTTMHTMDFSHLMEKGLVGPAHMEDQGLQGTSGFFPSITQCLGCHEFRWETGELGSAIHAIHGIGDAEEEDATCFNCHDTSKGEMVLWDEVKYENGKLSGITAVEEVTGDFEFDQEYTVSADELPNARWMANEWDQIRYENDLNNVPLDEEMFNNWEIKITGLVEEEVSFKLVDLIEQAPSVTVPAAMQCTINSTGGNQVAQVMITGIPLEWLLEQVNIKEEAVSFTWHSPDGLKAGYRGHNLDDLEDYFTYLVYEINGERLSWSNGYPCMLMIGSGADRVSKNFSELRIGSASFEMGPKEPGKSNNNIYTGDGTTSGAHKPNIGMLNTPDGKIIPAGESYTFEGWAHAWDLEITGIEFSMDGGETWDHHDTPNTNSNQWVHWEYTWTPPEADTAYVIMMRSVASDGRITQNPLQIMVNAKSEMPSVSEVS